MSWKSEFLHWDSNVFGYKVASVSGMGSYASFVQLLSALKSENIHLIYFFPDEPLQQKLEWNQFAKNTFFEEQITFTSENENFIFQVKDIEEYRAVELPNALIDLALRSGKYSRFNMDTEFQNNEFTKVYTSWIRNALDKSYDDIVFVFSSNDKVYGLITARKVEDKAVIGLLAVHTEYTQKYIGSKLVQAVKLWALENDLPHLQVKTQMKNIAAIPFYKHNQFTSVKTQEVYHIRL